MNLSIHFPISVYFPIPVYFNRPDDMLKCPNNKELFANSFIYLERDYVKKQFERLRILISEFAVFGYYDLEQ